jgi:putative FmdB family regulatory protein
MPLRDYFCEDCEHRYETLVRTIEDVPVRCPECGSENITQAVTAMGGIKGNFGTVPKRNAGSYKVRK